MGPRVTALYQTLGAAPRHDGAVLETALKQARATTPS